MTSKKCNKLVGAACGAGIILAMYRMVYGGFFLLFIAVPLALYYRRLLSKEEAALEALLKEKEFLAYYAATSLVSNEELELGQDYLIILNEQGIEFLSVVGEPKSKSKLDYFQIRGTDLFELDAIKIMTTQEKTHFFGDLGEELSHIKKEKKQDQVYYLVIDSQPLLYKQKQKLVFCITEKDVYLNNLFQAYQDVSTIFKKQIEKNADELRDKHVEVRI